MDGQENIPEKKNIYERFFGTKRYKLFFVVTGLLLIFSIGVLVNEYLTTGDWFEKSIELKGGLLITIQTQGGVDLNSLESALKPSFPSVSLKEATGIAGQKLIVKADARENSTLIIQAIEEQGIDVTDPSVEAVGPALGESFWRQAQLAMLFAFIFIGIVVFMVFRKLPPALMSMLTATSDMVTTLAFMQIFNIEMSLAAFGALLMMFGYSVDTDILLTTRMIKETGPVASQTTRAFKTGMTMTGTTVVALVILQIANISPVLTEIAAVLSIGLIADIAYTWLQNTALLRWYVESKGVVSQ